MLLTSNRSSSEQEWPIRVALRVPTGGGVAKRLNHTASSWAFLPGNGEQQDHLPGHAAKSLLTHNCCTGQNYHPQRARLGARRGGDLFF